MALTGVEGTRERLEALLVVLAGRLDYPGENDSVAALAGQYRSTVLALEELPVQSGSIVDQLTARRAARGAGG